MKITRSQFCVQISLEYRHNKRMHACPIIYTRIHTETHDLMIDVRIHSVTNYWNASSVLSSLNITIIAALTEMTNNWWNTIIVECCWQFISRVSQWSLQIFKCNIISKYSWTQYSLHWFVSSGFSRYQHINIHNVTRVLWQWWCERSLGSSRLLKWHNV
jgi:hypothetical protein